MNDRTARAIPHLSREVGDEAFGRQVRWHGAVVACPAIGAVGWGEVPTMAD